MEEIKPEAVQPEGLQPPPPSETLKPEAAPEVSLEPSQPTHHDFVLTQKTQKIRPFWLFLGALGLLVGVYFIHQAGKIKTHPLPQPLPTEMVFKGSVFKVQKAINKIFKSDPIQVFKIAPSNPAHFTLYWNGRKHPKEIKIFKNPVNENDVYISCNNQPICKTEVYTDWREKPLDYLADFQLHIIPQGAKETLVKVIVVNPEVAVGKTDSVVQATTIEESELLLTIKKILKKSSSSE